MTTPASPTRTFADLLRHYRQAAGLTQEELAERAGLSQRGINDLERGVRRNPRKHTVTVLAAALGLSPADHALLAVAAHPPATSGASGASGAFVASAAPPIAHPGQTPAAGDPSDGTPPRVQTFLIADVRGYSRFTAEHGDEAAARLAATFAALVRERVEKTGGRLLELRGDEALVVFESPRGALRAAVALQAQFAEATRADPQLPLLVGIGLDAGEAVPVEGGFRGSTLNLAARLCSVAAPGEVLVSETVISLAHKIEGLVYVAREPVRLKGFAEPVRLLQVLPADGAAEQAHADVQAAAAASTTQALGPSAASGARESVAPPPASGSMPSAPPSTSEPAGAPQIPGGLPRLVGRAPQLTKLDHVLAGTAPPVLVLAGEPGIGKTRLLQETATRAYADGWTVLYGGCHKRSRQDPYSPLLEALVSFLRDRSPAQARADLRDCGWLVRLLPELAQSAALSLPQWTLTPDQERRLMFEAVARFLSNIAGPSGTLLVLDDLQWAGVDALDLLEALVRSPGGSPLRVVGAYRDIEVRAQDPLAVLLVDLAREDLATRVELGPLAADEATELLDDLLAGVFTNGAVMTEQLVQRAGGVPFFLVSYAQGLRSGVLEGSAPGGVPWDIDHTIRQRVVALPEAAQDLLGAAAVIGRQAARELIMAVATKLGQDEPTVLTGLELACQARLLAEEGEDAYRFSHDLIREVIAAGLSAGRRAMLHRRVAETLEQAPGEPAADVLAYHYLRAGDAGKAVDYLERAGDRAVAMQAHASAESFYRELVERLDALGRTAQAAEAREKLGILLKNLARYREALEALERAADVYRAAGDLDAWARATTQIGASYLRSGKPDEGLRRLQLALDQSEASRVPPVRLAGLQIVRAQIFMATDQHGKQLDAAERAAEYARAAHDTQHLTFAQNHRGWALLMLSRTDEAVAALEEALRLAEAEGNLNALSYALNQLAAVHEVRGELNEHRTYIERALEVAERLGDPIAIALMVKNRGDVAYLAGDWAQARHEYERALTTLDRADTTMHSPYPLLGLGRLALAQGRWDEADKYLGNAIALAESGGNVEVLRTAHAELAERELLQKQPEAAGARLEPLLDHPGEQEIQVTALLPLLAWARAERGAEDEAAALLATCIARATAAHMQPALALARRVEGILAVRQGHWAEAERALQAALSLAQAIRYPYDEAKTLYWFGTALARKGGESRAARERLYAALVILSGLGERLYAELAERSLAVLASD